MMTEMEVLAPAGSPEGLQAAVRGGADAVYLGSTLFSARAGAKNFDAEALREAVRYCHARGVKVYLAVNTVLMEDELPAALALVQFACTLPVDAVLVQDTGLLRLLRRCAPGLRLHASTQMSLHTPCGAKAAQEAGFARVVLARELSLREIAEIHEACPVELEAFVHGALCMSVSGQCYFSAVLGSRSGNRGLCAQPCRLPFSVPGGTGHDLSLKDLSMISRVRELAGAGVCSAKIEGRLKRPEYAAAAARACRLAADGEPVPEELLKNLGAVFSRSGFTTGYPDGRLGREMFGVRSKEDAAEATSAVYAQIHELYKNELQRVPVHFILNVQKGEPVRLTVCDGTNTAAAEGPVPEPALHRPLEESRCAEQLKKTGGTPVFAESVACRLEEGLTFPVSALNRLRREALDKLLALRAERPAVPFAAPALEAAPHTAGPMALRARFAGSDLPEEARQCELVYLPYDTPVDRLNGLRRDGFRVALEIPRGLFGMEKAVRLRLAAAKEAGFSHVWAGNLSAAQLGKELGLTVHGGFSLNITNSQALEWYRAFGLADAELSFELTLSKTAALGGALPRGLLLYGRLPLMLTRNCPAANAAGGCQSCGGAPELTDRRHIKFPVRCYGACSEVLNSVPLFLADRLAEVKNQDFGLLRFTTESPREAAQIIRDYRSGAPAQGEYTRGLYYRGIE